MDFDKLLEDKSGIQLGEDGKNNEKDLQTLGNANDTRDEDLRQGLNVSPTINQLGQQIN